MGWNSVAWAAVQTPGAGEPSIWILVPVAVILLTQSTLLFLDARKRGANAWFWGIIGLIQAPLPTIFYLLLVRKVYKRWRWRRR
ncbi:sigma-Y antisigma factor component [Paenibacillus chartarius]|uniref:Sigma-Y antisigma factor component n=1 Tax=Paenibacillus chartarius TaxID=747481 RepID=A0ABV6DSD8_9BACL